MRIRVVTWNVHSCVGTDGLLNPSRTADVLESLDADLIGLQEVDWRHPPTDGLDQLDYFAARLGMHAIEGPNLHDHAGRFGNALLARREPQQCARVDLSVQGREPRGAIDAVFQFDRFSLRVLVTHFGLTRTERSHQMGALQKAIEAGLPSDAVVLLGDLNEWRRGGRAIPLVPDPFPIICRMRTFPSRVPLFALDAVLARPEPKHVYARTAESLMARKASDHLPIVVDLEW